LGAHPVSDGAQDSYRSITNQTATAKCLLPEDICLLNVAGTVISASPRFVPLWVATAIVFVLALFPQIGSCQGLVPVGAIGHQVDLT